MAIRREHDWVGVNLANPDFTNTDFKDAGVNIQNTSIGPESVYLNSPQIRQNPQFQTDGTFDPSKFHDKYVELAKSYNDLAKDTYSRDIKNKGRIFAENDIFVSPEERRQSSGAFITLVNNPDHITYGIVGVNEPGPRTKTPMELAEGHPIFDSQTGKFTEESPEDSFFKYFWRPKMMATYDENVDINGNPTNDPTKIAHFKGEYKLTDDGEYYTEFVNGRSTYGKEIVSYWNILTKEDSPLNKYDPFDSDDIKKSTAGSIARNALKILPLLVPSVAPYYAMASIGINLVDALGTLGKLVVGSENPVLNNITAFSESFNQTVSEEGMQHTFGMENILNMVGDTFMFLKSQRILAEQAPKLFMSETAEIMKDPKARIGELVGEYTKAQQLAIDAKYEELSQGVSDLLYLTREKEKELATVASIAGTRAEAIVNNQIQNFHKLGRQISTSMMAITFGLHTYGTAKAQGVTDEAATALTLGAIAGQYAILGSHIGQKIFPEANVQRQQIKKSLETWLGGNIEGGFKANQEAIEAAVTNVEKQKAASSMFKKGAQLAKQIWDAQETIGGTIAASTAATAIEMSAFTALDDLIASTYNLASWISGNDNRMMAWNDIVGRYGSAMIGGAIAGAMGARDIYRNAQAVRNINTQKAFELLVYMINEGKEGDIIREIDKHDWGNTNLSTEVVARRQLDSGEYEDLYGTPAEERSQNDEVKKVMKQAIYDLKEILTTYGAKISQDSLLDVMVNGKNITKDLRLAVLRQSSYAQYYLDRFIKNQVKIYTNAKELSIKPQARQERGETDADTRAINQEVREYEKSIEPPAELKQKKQTTTQETPDTSPEASVKIKAKRDLKDALELNRKFLNGDLRAEFIDKALFEMQYSLNAPFIDAAFREYVKNRENGTEYEDVALTRKRELAIEFYKRNSGEGKMDLIDQAYSKFKEAIGAISLSLKDLLKKENNEKLNDFLKVFQTENIAIRNSLFGLINPYEEILDSIFKLTVDGESNTPERPENVWAREHVARYTPLKETIDLLYLVDLLMERYKGKKDGVFSGNKDAMEAIQELRTLFSDIGLYKKFLLGLKLRGEQAAADYKLRVDEAIAKGEPQPTDGPEFKFTRESIENELAQHYLSLLRQETIDKELEGPTVKKAMPAEDRIFKMFENMSKAIERYKAEGNGAVADKLQQIRDFMLSPDFLENTEMAIENSIAKVINVLIYKTVGEQLIEELENILPENSYLDDYSKQQLLNLIRKFEKIQISYDGSEGFAETYQLQINIPGTSSKTNFIKLLGAIEPGGIYDKINVLVDSIFNKDKNPVAERRLLTTRFDEVRRRIESINSEGILAAADRLKEALEIRGGKISDLIKIIDAEVSKKTSPFTGFSTLNPQITRANEIIFTPEIIDEINAAILVLQMMRSGYAASADEVKTVFNHVGFAVTHNKILEQTNSLNDENRLTVISLEQANDGIDHITDFIYKLMYWREIASNALKLRTEISDQADLGLRLNLVEQLSKKIDSLDTTIWKGVSEFRNEVNNLLTIQGLINGDRNNRLAGASKATKDKVLRELFTFKKALHTFFRKNMDNVNDPEKLATFINLENFKLRSKIHAINLEDKLQDESGLLWFLAATCALDPDVYASNLKEALSGQRLPIELQDIWKYEGAAFIFYQDIFNKFADALVYSESQKPEYADLTSDDPEKKKAAKILFAKNFLNVVVNPRRRNIQLISSGAGFGKSTFVPEFVMLLKKLDPTLDINRDYWIIGPEDQKAASPDQMAIKMREACGGETTPTFTRDTLMKKIIRDFDAYEARFKVVNGRLTLADGDKITVNLETGGFDLNVELNDGITNLPRVIILDEVSDYSTFDLDLIDQFAKKNNIKVIALGDFTQSGIGGQIKVDFGDGVLVDNILGALDYEFIRTFKSQLTFRTQNVQTEKNNILIRTYVDKYLDYVQSEGRVNSLGNDIALKLYYYFDDKTGALYGTKVITPTTGDQLTEETKKYIDGMYKSLQEGETITLLYSKDTSEVYKYITSHQEWQEKTNFRQGTTLKSSEDTYYIIDLDNNLDESEVIDSSNKDWATMERLAREFYTALTRQKRGSLFIDRFSDKLEKFRVENHPMDPDTQEIAMPKQFIEERAIAFKELLDELFPTQLTLADAEIPVNNPPPPLPPNPPTIDGDTGRTVDTEHIEQDGDQDSFDMFKKKSEQADDDLDRRHALVIKEKKEGEVFSYNGRSYPGTGTPTSIVDEQLYYTLYTFNAQRSGLKIDGSLDQNPDRRDVAHGLIYIHNQLMQASGNQIGLIRDPTTLMPIDFSTIDTTKPLPKDIQDTIIGLLTRVQSLAWTCDNTTLISELKNLLGQSDDLSIRYLVLTRQATMPDSNADPLIDLDRTQEKCWGAQGSGTKNGEINRTELVLFIGKNSGKTEVPDEVLLTVPVATFPNYATIIEKSNGQLDSRIVQEYNTLRLNRLNPYDQAEKMYSFLLQHAQPGVNNIPGAAALLKVLEFFLSNTSSAFYLGPNFQLAKTKTGESTRGLLENLGWFMNTSARGFDYSTEGYELGKFDLTPVQNLLVEPDKDISRIYVAWSENKLKFVTNKKGTSFYTGGYYILIANKGEFRNISGDLDEAEMFRYFSEQLTDPTKPVKVKAVQVRPPAADFETFIKSEYSTLYENREGGLRQDVGNQFTILRILQKLFTLDEDENFRNDMFRDEFFEEQGISPRTYDEFRKAVRFIAGLSMKESELNYKSIKQLVWKLTYLEGQLSAERKTALGRIYEVAESKLDDTEKQELRDVIDAATSKNYVSVLCSYLSLKNTGDLFNNRNKLRYFLQHLWNPGNHTRDQVFDEYDRAAVQSFIRVAGRDQAILYNPEFQKDPINTEGVQIVDSDGNLQKFTFHLVNNNSLQGSRNPYMYKDAPFMYASRLLQSPLVGNITAIIDFVLKQFNPVASNGRIYINAPKELSSCFKHRNIFNKRPKAKVNHYFIGGIKSEVDIVNSIKDQDSGITLENIDTVPNGIFALNFEPNKIAFFRVDALKLNDGETVDRSESIQYSNLSDFDKQNLDSNTVLNAENVILKVFVKDGGGNISYRYYTIPKTRTAKKLIDVTKKSTEYNPLAQQFGPAEIQAHNSIIFNVQTSLDGRVKLYIPYSASGSTAAINSIGGPITRLMEYEGKLYANPGEPTQREVVKSDFITDDPRGVVVMEQGAFIVKVDGTTTSLQPQTVGTFKYGTKNIENIYITPNSISIKLEDGTIIRDNEAKEFLQNSYSEVQPYIQSVTFPDNQEFEINDAMRALLSQLGQGRGYGDTTVSPEKLRVYSGKEPQALYALLKAYNSTVAKLPDGFMEALDRWIETCSN